ncbi:TetR/AcrR family transcriptional regulator [Amycolatopsis tucumanensis]|uniref:TetR/AcrR family transcriptional regulator n=1 Tax=Amycolatopsis tucumanensis TaxID=401106 RepID=A0ABP7IBN8_9PSEU|nr:TetR/AcrR family transcriptional regulator [Amycolatopsis tucumanensis]MCF6422579.1 TetR/AcrR family transcriptional regulator [Amycolatopsis tucumanensis]
MTDSQPRWRRLEPDARREQIFTCAARLFGERPYADVSTSDIAAAAGVARGLINHYFGTKRELYLAVLRRTMTIPTTALDIVTDGPLEEKARVAVDWFLTLVTKQGKTWLVATAPEGLGSDPEVEAILVEAERRSAARVLEALGVKVDAAHAEVCNALIRAYGGMVKAAGREWLLRGELDRDQVHTLLSRSLVTLIEDVFPAVTDK